MSNFRKFISMSAVAILGVTNLLTPLSYATAAETPYDDLTIAQLKVKMLKFMMPDKDVYLKAYTEANQYYVDYDGNTHTSGDTPSTTHTYDTPSNLATNGYFKTGYTFTGWNRASDGQGTGYADGEANAVNNWTTVSGGRVGVFATWTPNVYKISYNLGDSAGTSSGVHTKTPTGGVYDETLTIAEPTRQGYTFTGWTITNMDTNVHTLGSESNTGNAETATKVKGTSFKNLTAISGNIVNFLAVWDPDKDTAYTVKHYKQNKDGSTYPETATDTDNLTGVTDSEVTPARKDYDGFTAPAGITTGIKADGSTEVRYDYVRNHYNLTLIAGTGVATATAVGDVNDGDSVSAGGSKDISFLYEEEVTLSQTLLPGYQNPVWSGYSTTASVIEIPYNDVAKEVYASPITYPITYTYSGGTPQNDPTEYTVESETFSLANNLERLHSTFSGWIGGLEGDTQITTPTKNVTIEKGSTGTGHFTAVWDCLEGFHETEERDACIADTNTAYTVKHYQEPIGGGTHVFVEQETLYGTTLDDTSAQPKDYAGFTPQPITQKQIKGDKSTVVEVLYDRNSYDLTVNQPTEAEAGAITPTASATTLANGEVKFDDTVTVTVTIPDGYTFVGWTGTSASGDIVFANSGATTTTFHMPAADATVRPIVTLDSYDITYILHNGTVDGTNPTTYNVETATFTLINPTRDNGDSVFVGWSGGVVGETPTTSSTVTITKGGDLGDRVYEAIWDCRAGYHAEGDSCVANHYSGSVDYNDGESHGAAEVIEFTYDQVTTLGNPSQSGYDFSGWIVTGMSGGVEHTLGTLKTTENSASVDSGATQFMNLSTEQGYTDIKFTADWTPRNDTKYTVYYYYKELGKTTYELSGTAVEKEGTTDTSVTLAELAAMGGHPSEGFTYSAGYLNVAEPTTRPSEGAVLTGNINKDGSQKIYLYFTRNVHTVYLSGDANVDPTGFSGAGTHEYGEDVTVNMTPKTGYHFKEWQKKTAEDNAGNTYLPNS